MNTARLELSFFWRTVAPFPSGAMPVMDCSTHRPETYIHLPFTLLPSSPSPLTPPTRVDPAHRRNPPSPVHIWTMSLDDLQLRANHPRDSGSKPLFYHMEKDGFAGFLLGAILYGTRELSPSTRPLAGAHFFLCPFFLGVLIVLFFQCMATLLSPAHRRGEGIKWGLVTYTVVMFSFVTVYTAMNLHIQSLAFIDNRSFTYLGVPFGPLGWQSTIRRTVIGMFPTVMFVLNYWLADGLLVGSLFDAASARPVPNVVHSSSIVATSSTPRMPGSSSSPASCTLPHGVRI